MDVVAMKSVTQLTVNGDHLQGAIGALFKARAVAVVGISADHAKLGNVILRNVVKNGFAGNIYGVCRAAVEPGVFESGYERVRFVQAFSEIDEPVDVALFAVPADMVVTALASVPLGRLRLAVILASGFTETGERGASLETALRQYCLETQLPVVGPNCQGVVVPGVKLQMTFSPMYNQMLEGKVAIVSQSGAMAGYMANNLMRRGVGLCCVVSSGNEAVLTAADYIHALADKPECRVVLCYIEQIKNGRHFARSVQRLGAQQRIVVVKSGRSTAGVAAASSHTGAMASDDRVIDGVFRQLGVVRARDSATAIDVAMALANGRRMKGGAVGILSVAGGLAVELSDLLELDGFTVPPFDPDTLERLKAKVPEFGASRNPIDLSGAILTQESLFEEVLNLFARAKNLDGFAIISTFIRNPAFAHAIVRMYRSTDKPVVVCWTGTPEQTPESLEILARSGIPIYGDTGRVALAFRAIRGDTDIS